MEHKLSCYTLIKALLSHCEIGLNEPLALTSPAHRNVGEHTHTHIHTLLNESQAPSCGIVGRLIIHGESTTISRLSGNN